MNILQFPSNRPEVSVADDLVIERARLEIELIRARLAQINQETQQVSVLWWWWCFKRVLILVIALWIAVIIAGAAEAADTMRKSFYGRTGSFEGTSIERGNSGQYFNGQGRFSGSSVRSGNQTLYFDHQGRFSGSTIDRGPRR